MVRPSAERADERLITFRLRTLDQPTELRGDFWHFFHATTLTPQRSGHQEATLRLGPGVYSYKFRTPDGVWHLDPENGRTRSVDGLRNSLLIVGGTDEPVMHAPARPFLHEGQDGRIWVRAGLRRGAAAGLSVRLFEDGAIDVPMRQVGAEDEHLLFEAALPASRREVEYVFVLPDGRSVGAPGGAGQALRARRRALASAAPAWWRDAVVYTIFVDRFRRGEGAVPAAPLCPPLPLDGQVPRSFYVPPERLPFGGDLRGVIAALPALCALGVTALHLTPIGRSPSAHRYDAIDPREVDPALGGAAALRDLLHRAHELGLRVLLDMVLTHVHRDFFAFADVRARGPASPYWDWFRVRRYPFIDGPDPGYDHYQKGQWQEPLLNLECEDVLSYLSKTFAGYAELGVDGFRVDAAADVPLPALRRIREVVDRPGLVFYGEVIPDSTHRYTGEVLHAATDFALQGVVRQWLWQRSAGVDRVAEVMARRRFYRGGPGWTGVGFCATHDQHRLLSLVGDPRVSRLAHLLLLVRPEVPALYYGDEVGLRCADLGRDFEDVWPDRQPMPWDEAAWDKETLGLVRGAARLRREIAALRLGDEEVLPVPEAEVLVVRRVLGDEVIEVYLHGGEGRVEVPLWASAPSGAAALLSLGEAEVVLDRVALGPWAGLVVRRVLPPQGAALWGAVLDHNRGLCDEAFRRGLTTHPGLPAHLYLTVTEACNLRCRHCITDAPARTKDGRARVMRPWVVEALGGALAAAEYFGFAHGGESLVAPIFWDLLGAIRRARGGRRYDVHLLSNGMLLRQDVVRRLIDLGVSSLAVSLDGARAQTNDEVRVGARFGEILANVAGAVLLRQEMGADLRIGISTVVMAQNVGEMAALGRLCRELGVDWIKVEELFAVNGFCRRSMIAPSARGVAEGMDALRREAGPGIVVVDHLAAPAGCRCEGDDAVRAFRDADDFANRARFHPCSMAFEQACVDPDGTVRPVDYYHQPLGNLAQAPFPELWNSEVARRLRAQVLRRVPIEQRLRCPRG